MADDRSQFNQALRKWDTLHTEASYSLPVDEGDVAILCSDFEMGEPVNDVPESVIFKREAERIADTLMQRDIPSEIYYGFTTNDAQDVLTDPTFSSVITIGNGNLSETYAHGGVSVDWRFVSLASDHLKTGRFTMRQCGHAIRHLSAPMGTFAMSDHSDVFAAHGKYLPAVMEASDERLIQRVHTHRRIGYGTIKNLFQQIELAKDDEQTEETIDAIA